MTIRWNKFLQRLIPPDAWKRPVVVLLGILSGLAAYAFYISKAPSYLSDSPKTCINCHVMNPQFNDWAHSSHRLTATCNDCHVPHNNVFSKYAFKLRDGIRHATIFTLRAEPQVIYIHQAGAEVVQANCVRCHERTVRMEFLCSVQPGYSDPLMTARCVRCHRETPHSRVNSLSSVPNALVSE